LIATAGIFTVALLSASAVMAQGTAAPGRTLIELSGAFSAGLVVIGAAIHKH